MKTDIDGKNFFKDLFFTLKNTCVRPTCGVFQHAHYGMTGDESFQRYLLDDRLPLALPLILCCCP